MLVKFFNPFWIGKLVIQHKGLNGTMTGGEESVFKRKGN